jgi:hypothetical protein
MHKVYSNLKGFTNFKFDNFGYGCDGGYCIVCENGNGYICNYDYTYQYINNDYIFYCDGNDFNPCEIKEVDLIFEEK